MPKVMVNKRFVTFAEADFYRVLRSIVGDRGHILAQVALNRLLFFPGNRQTEGRASWQNKVARKSVDFVICDPQTLVPKLVIELDDSSHDSETRQRRDNEVDRLFAAAELPVLHVKCAKTYHVQSLAEQVLPYLFEAAPAEGPGGSASRS